MPCIYLTGIVGALPLLVSAVLLCGCGGGGEMDGGESYAEILHGLRKAALSHHSYSAVGRAEDLKPTLRASIDAFCEVNREMLTNKEAWKAAQGGYYIDRIKLRAERELPFVSTAPVNAAVNEYKGLFELTSFDADAVRSYDKACYHAKFWY